MKGTIALCLATAAVAAAQTFPAYPYMPTNTWPAAQQSFTWPAQTATTWPGQTATQWPTQWQQPLTMGAAWGAPVTSLYGNLGLGTTNWWQSTPAPTPAGTPANPWANIMLPSGPAPQSYNWGLYGTAGVATGLYGNLGLTGLGGLGTTTNWNATATTGWPYQTVVTPGTANLGLSNTGLGSLAAIGVTGTSPGNAWNPSSLVWGPVPTQGVTSLSAVAQSLGFTPTPVYYGVPAGTIEPRGTIQSLPVNTYFGTLGTYSIGSSEGDGFVLNDNGKRLLEEVESAWRPAIERLASNPYQNGLYQFVSTHLNNIIPNEGFAGFGN